METGDPDDAHRTEREPAGNLSGSIYAKGSLRIHSEETAKELYQIFGSYQPELTERDFYELEIGSAGIMRGYMAHPCDAELTLEKKLRLFFTMSLRAYNVPEEEIGRVIRFVEGLDIRTISEQVMQKLFKALAMHYEFSLQG